jgi:hypothetical protein
MTPVASATAALSIVICASFLAAMRTPATAAANVTVDQAYCLSSNEGGNDCGFVSLQQCQASASGTNASCYANFRAVQNDPAAQPRPGPRRRGGR